MPVHNGDIAARFEEIADLLEIEGANAFRVRAYRNAARMLRDLPQSAASMLEDGKDLSDLPGIGEDLAGKIAEIVKTGSLSQLDALEKEVPAGLTEVVAIPGIGPKRAHALHETLDVTSLADLEQAARSGRIREVPGFGRKTEQNILHALETRGSGKTRTRLREAEEVAEALVEWLREVDGVHRATIAGSYRRRRETVGDIDILATCARDSPVVDRFVAYEDVRDIVSQGRTRSTVILKNGLQVDLRVVARVAYGAALHYFTGSKAHNIRVRRMGQDRQLKINEYGVFRGKKRVAGRTEEEVYEQVGLPWIDPVLREDRGEIEAAQKHKLPELIRLDDIRGNLHSHTKASDGTRTLAQMAAAAKARGWSYLAISDHSKAVTVANGLDAERLAEQIDAIDALNEELDGITLLKSCEVDILADGSLDLPDDILARLDLTVCAVHSHMDLSRDKQTERVLKAMDHPCFNIMAHPTGRLIGTREPYPLDIERVIEHARDTGCILELNAQPDRLDLDDGHCKMARDSGVRLSIGTDAHAEAHLDFMRYGVDQARRGWVEAADVVNTLELDKLRKALAR